MYFLNYGLLKTWLDQRLKSPVSEHPSKSNLVNGSKDRRNSKESSFTIFIDHCKDNCLTKSFS